MDVGLLLVVVGPPLVDREVLPTVDDSRSVEICWVVDVVSGCAEVCRVEDSGAAVALC